MKFIKQFVDNRSDTSLATRTRRKRFAFFETLLSTVPRPMRILDVGGTQRFWETMGFVDEPNIHITILNINAPKIKFHNFTGVAGDATDMNQFSNHEFDVVFSNSVIEHVGDLTNQLKMAQEVRRLGKRYFIQTPNYYFPIEPHFLFPGYQWLPVAVRVWLLMHYDLGWRKRTKDSMKAREQVEGIRLLRRKDIEKLFPEAKLYEERALGLVKSYIAYFGW